MSTYGLPTICRSCGADIVWVQTPKGHRMPVDLAGWKKGETTYIHGQHVSHFATCPQAKAWRRPK